MKFGQRVGTCVKGRGPSQRALASLIGVNITYVSKIENERLNFGEYSSEDLICRIAATLEIDPDELLHPSRFVSGSSNVPMCSAFSPPAALSQGSLCIFFALEARIP